MREREHAIGRMRRLGELHNWQRRGNGLPKHPVFLHREAMSCWQGQNVAVAVIDFQIQAFKFDAR